MRSFAILIASFILSAPMTVARDDGSALAEAIYKVYAEKTEAAEDPIIGRWEPYLEVNYEDKVEYDRHNYSECQKKNWLQFWKDGGFSMGGPYNEIDGDCVLAEEAAPEILGWKKVAGSSYILLLPYLGDEYIEKSVKAEFPNDGEMILTIYWDSEDLDSNYDVFNLKRIN